jgi:hypothetical protein
LTRRVAGPLSEIDGLSAFVDAIRHEPGERRNIRVPGPDGRIRMTITA